MSTAADFEAFQLHRLQEKAESIATSLERLASRVRQHGAEFSRIGVDRGPRTYGSVAGRIQHEVTWGFANLGIDSLPDLSTDADMARMEGRFSPKPLLSDPPAT